MTESVQPDQTAVGYAALQAAALSAPSGPADRTVRARVWRLVGQRLMRITFHNWYGLRRYLLGLFGASVHPTARIRPSARISHPWSLSIGAHSSIGDWAILHGPGPIRIGVRCTISQYAHLHAGAPNCLEPDEPVRTSAITVEDDAWIAADTFVGPGVTVGEGAILGTRSSAYSDLEPWSIYAGDPARRLRARPSFADAAESQRDPADADRRL